MSTKTPHHNLFIGIGALFAMLAVLFGAFAAHGLKSSISSENLAIFQTGVTYMFYHAFGLILWGLWGSQKQLNSSITGCLFCFGNILFPGSLFLIVFTGIKTFGMITPIGGLCYIIGWFFFAKSAFSKQKKIIKECVFSKE